MGLRQLSSGAIWATKSLYLFSVVLCRIDFRSCANQIHWKSRSVGFHCLKDEDINWQLITFGHFKPSLCWIPALPLHPSSQVVLLTSHSAALQWWHLSDILVMVLGSVILTLLHHCPGLLTCTRRGRDKVCTSHRLGFWCCCKDLCRSQHLRTDIMRSQCEQGGDIPRSCLGGCFSVHVD